MTFSVGPAGNQTRVSRTVDWHLPIGLIKRLERNSPNKVNQVKFIKNYFKYSINQESETYKFTLSIRLELQNMSESIYYYSW